MKNPYPVLAEIPFCGKKKPDSIITNSLSANLTKVSDTLKQFVGNLPTNYSSVFDHFVGLALKGLTY